MAPESVIELHEVEFSYPLGNGPEPTFMLHVQELRVLHGEHIACVGPSGSGKSTLVNLMAGILIPTRGSVLALGHDLSALNPGQRRRLRLSRIGMVFQEFELLEYLTAEENVLLPRRLLPELDAASLRERARSLMARAGVGHLKGRTPARLSQGERQRVALCRALVTSPMLILCDEPLGNLDPAGAAGALDLLLREADELGATVFMITHNHALLGRFSRVVEVTRSARGAVVQELHSPERTSAC